MGTRLEGIRRSLFRNPADGLLSLVLLLLLGWGGVAFLRWALFRARWAVIQMNATLFAVGRYPLDQQWRLWLLTALLAAAAGGTWGMLRAHPRRDRSGRLWPPNDRLAFLLLAALALALPAALALP